MTPAERTVLEHLGRAWKAFQLLPASDTDRSQFANAIAAPMNIVLAREGARTLQQEPKP